MGVSAFEQLDLQLGHGVASKHAYSMTPDEVLSGAPSRRPPSASSNHAVARPRTPTNNNNTMRPNVARLPTPSYRPSTPSELQQQQQQQRPRTPTQMAAAAARANPEADFERQRLRKEMLSATESSMNSRFSDMFKAFQYIDLDRSGRLSRAEILRALKLWNIPVDGERMEALMEVCDKDGDGISYEEFCDTLARDTVAPAAQGKRDMQSGAAMGVSAFEQLDLQLGHGVASKHAYSMSD